MVAESEQLVLVKRGLKRASLLAGRVHTLLANIASTQKDARPGVMTTLRELVTQAAAPLRTLERFERAELSRLIHEVSVEQKANPTPIEELSSWAEKLWTFNSILRRALLHITLTHRLKEEPHTSAPVLPQLSEAEVAELKRLNAQMLFAQIALGEEHVEAVGTRLNLDPTSVCNVRCVTCYQNYSHSFEPHVIPIEALNKALESLLFFEGLDIFGLGEPTLSRQLSLICEYISSTHVRANLLTNGTLLSRRGLPLDKLHSVTISWDGARAETLEQLRLGVSYDGTLERIRDVRAKFPRLHLGFNVTVNRANMDEIPDIVRLAGSLGMQQVNFTRIYGPPHLDQLCLTLNDVGELERLLLEAREAARTYEINVSSAIHYDGLRESAEPIQKIEVLAKYAERPAAERTTKDSLGSLCEEIRAVGDLRFPFFLPEWVHSTPIEDAKDQAFTVDIEALREQVGAKLEKLRQTPAESLIVPFCMSPWVHNFVTASGGLRPCCLITDDYGQLTRPGNMLHHLNSQKFVELRRGLLGKGEHPAPCRGCTFIERYHSLPDYFSFLESLGKTPEDLRFPEEFNPGPTVKIRPRRQDLVISQLEKRSLHAELPTGGDSVEGFRQLANAGLFEASDIAYVDSLGNWYRAVWMAEATTCVAFAALNSSAAIEAEFEAESLARGLWRRLGKVAPCSMISAEIRMSAGNKIWAAVTFKNSSENWLWGLHARGDGHDVVGFRFIDSNGVATAEARLQFPNQCIPPGATRTLSGVITMCDEAPTPGTYRVEVDIVREVVNWSLPVEQRRTIDFEYCLATSGAPEPLR